MKTQLFGKTALVTGASSGIGRALAKALGKKGVVLAISARRKQALDTLADEIEAAGAKRPVVLTADLSKRGEAGSSASGRSRRSGASTSSSTTPASASAARRRSSATTTRRASCSRPTTGRRWRWCARWCPGCASGGTGAVVNVASIGAFAPMPLGGHYCSSKAALSLHSEALRLELRGSGIHVFNVQPGPVDTGMLAELAAVPGGGGFLESMPHGSPTCWPARSCAASSAASARWSIPTSLAIARHLPTVALRAAALLRAASTSTTAHAARRLAGRRAGRRGPRRLRARRRLIPRSPPI